MLNTFQIWKNMMQTVISFATKAENLPVTNSVLKFKNGIISLTQMLADINATIGDQGQSNLGYADYKSMIKRGAATNAVAVIAPALSWCKDTNNPVLAEKIKFSYSTLVKVKDAVFADTLQKVYDLLLPNAAALVDYGVTAGSFTSLATSIADFNTFNAEPRQAIVSKKQKTELLNRQMRDANNFCKNILDKLAVAFKAAEQEYYDGYKAARKLVPTGHTTTKYRGVIKDEVTGKVIVGAIVAVEGTDLIGKSDIKGKVVIDGVPFGIRKLKAGAEGFTSQLSDPIEFKKGQYVTLNFSLVPAFVLPENAPVTVPTNS